MKMVVWVAPCLEETPSSPPMEKRPNVNFIWVGISADQVISTLPRLKHCYRPAAK